MCAAYLAQNLGEDAVGPLERGRVQAAVERLVACRRGSHTVVLGKGRGRNEPRAPHRVGEGQTGTKKKPDQTAQIQLNLTPFRIPALVAHKRHPRFDECDHENATSATHL